MALHLAPKTQSLMKYLPEEDRKPHIKESAGTDSALYELLTVPAYSFPFWISILLSLYFDPFRDLVSDHKSFVPDPDDHTAAATADQTDRTAFFHLLAVQEFNNFRHAKHPFDRVGLTRSCLR